MAPLPLIAVANPWVGADAVDDESMVPSRAGRFAMMRYVLGAVAVTSILTGVWSGLQGLFFPLPASNAAGGRTPVSPIEARRLLSSMPLRSDLWLVLSDATGDLVPASETDGPLQMAYLTGAGKTHEIGHRLESALRSRAFAGKTVQDFVKGDVNVIVHRAPALVPLIRDAYRTARPENKEAFVTLLRDADPTLVSALAAMRCAICTNGE